MSKFKIEKKVVAQVRFYETLYLVNDAKGNRIYTGSEEAAKRIAAVLNRYTSPKRKAKSRRKKR